MIAGVPRVIDIHAHNVPCGWPDLGEATGEPGPWPWLRLDSERDAMIMLGDAEFRAVTSECWDPVVRLAEMDADGVDAQVVSPTPVFFHYGSSARAAEGIARIFNDLAAEMAAASPDRLLPFCQVPLQDLDAAIRELDRCLAQGHRGVEIGNHVGDRDLDDPGIVEFLRHCAEVGAPVLVHPWDMPSSPRSSRWMAQWLVGMPAETHLSILSLVLGGVFDRIDERLRICFAHGGGSFPTWIGRLDNAWHRKGDPVSGCEQVPSAYLDRFSVDTVVFAPESLRLLVDTMGPGGVMMGSDYPYPLGERPAGAVVRAAGFLDEDARSAILGGNAEAFLGLESDDRGRAAVQGGRR